MKQKTTRQLSDEHEEHLVDALERWNSRRSSSSGAMFNDPNDVTSDIHVVECKATEGLSISVKLSDWNKTRVKAYNGATPAMAFRFKDPYNGKAIDLIMIELDEYIDLRERNENN